MRKMNTYFFGTPTIGFHDMAYFYGGLLIPVVVALLTVLSVYCK